ncbi:LAMI_0G02872g1_1 [Lachancea mirantina]|uniref:LAMI_0G02872g1_1 n=1 Tax=Lachancea mirantina TaxID=1230905 RepID=A0A1G4K821_9SACH|nr:LAMI_0G02872g1_1 [Lachancea mirantina]
MRKKNHRILHLILAVGVVYLTYGLFFGDGKQNEELSLRVADELVKDKTENRQYGRIDRTDLALESGFQTIAKSCPNFAQYASKPHTKDSGSEISSRLLPYQRPPEKCRTFRSKLVERFLDEFLAMFKDPNLARLFENAFPNTLDTTILWHVTGNQNMKLNNHRSRHSSFRNSLPETFVVTGDIHAEWLRDSARQLSVYQPFIKEDTSIREMIQGAINSQAQLVQSNPYCNAFHPPVYSPVVRGQGSIDSVYPRPDWRQVFECKYELDSLASFLTISREFYENARPEDRFRFLNEDWILALENLLVVLRMESVSTFDETGVVNPFYYTFQRQTNVASETLPLAGTGNPVKGGTGLVRSAFRPSDDATVFQFLVPANAQMAVELAKTVEILQDYQDSFGELPQGVQHKFNVRLTQLIDRANSFADSIHKGIMEHAVVEHPKFGTVFAYEVDGYGSHLLMDDANIPSLLSLPELGFLERTDKIYQNTRKMITSKDGNPYYIQGTHFQGIGGPHIGIHNAWPMSLIVLIRTSTSDAEIESALKALLENTAGLGLIHESIQAFHEDGSHFTRPWFSWANSEFAKMILQLAETHPHLILEDSHAKDKFQLPKFLHALQA